MNNLVTIHSVNGDENDRDAGKTHAIIALDDSRTICSGLVFSEESDFTLKKVKRGGITCETCLDVIKRIKSIKL